MIATEQITGLILAGGRGSRMGGVDKGLQPLASRPLVAHVLERLRPQVGPLLINANRHLAQYAGFGHPLVSDADASFAGPLAGLLAGLRQAPTDWLLSVPCDAPRLPPDLSARLAAAIAAAGSNAALALPVTADGRLQPVFCLLQRGLRDSLAAYLQGGGRKMETWLRQQPHRLVPFERPDDAAAFFNANSLAELQGLESLEQRP